MSDRGTGIDLPGIHDDANDESGRGQTRYVRLSAVRLTALLLGAIFGTLSWSVYSFDASGLLLLLAFVIAAFAELALIRLQPERNWYAGRAVAESVKTLSWRFAVQGEPFGPQLDQAAAEALLRSRVGEVLRRGQDRITIRGGAAVVTPSMIDLRRQDLETRRRTYLVHRTEDQRAWYSSNARKNERRATALRYGLLFGELIAVVIAAVTLGRSATIDFAGIVAALVAAGAAWLTLRQYSQLTSAYRIAAGELAIQARVLETVVDSDWPQAVADAEEAISREHTMWLASRGEEPLRETTAFAALGRKGQWGPLGLDLGVTAPRPPHGVKGSMSWPNLGPVAGGVSERPFPDQLDLLTPR